MHVKEEVLVEKLQELLDSEYPSIEDVNDLIEQIQTECVTGINVREKLKTLSIHHLISCAEYDEPLEIVKVLFNLCPDIINVSSNKFFQFTVEEGYYPLHAACQNAGYNDYADAIFEFILDKVISDEDAKGLDHMCLLGDGVVECYKEVRGTPLHYYLSHGSRCKVNTVKRLLEACPEALTTTGARYGFTPLHTMMIEFKPNLEVFKYLVQSNPLVLHTPDSFGRLPIHHASDNEDITLDAMKFLIEAYPESLEGRDWDQKIPLHYLLNNKRIESENRTVALDILKLFIEKAPNWIFQERDIDGMLPITVAASCHSADFCKLLVDLCPGSERDSDNEDGIIAIFRACMEYDGKADTVKYLAELYPDSIHMTYATGRNPFSYALCSSSMEKAGMVQHLLDIDRSFASTPVQVTPLEPMLPLHIVCTRRNDPRFEEGRTCSRDITPDSRLVKILYDAHPSAILARDSNSNQPLDAAKDALEAVKEETEDSWKRNKFEEVYSFLETQHSLAVVAEGKAFHETDKQGSLLLHRALEKKEVSIGTIKWIIDGNTNAIQLANNSGRRPLHLACMNSTLDIVQYLLSLDTSAMSNLLDADGNNALHLACRGYNCELMTHLLEHHMSLATGVNKVGLLPLHLLCDKSGKEGLSKFSFWNRKPIVDSKEYVDYVWRLLSAYPSAISSAVGV